MSSMILNITFDCADANLLADFWSRVTGYQEDPEDPNLPEHTEALLLSSVGGLAGVLAAQWGVAALVRLAPPDLPLGAGVSISLPVLGFALGLSVLIAIALGVGHALQATSANVQQALAEHGRSQTVSSGSQRLGRIIVEGQIAITIVLLTGAGLLGRSLLRVLAIDPGFRTEHIVTMGMALPFTEQDADKVRRV